MKISLFKQIFSSALMNTTSNPNIHAHLVSEFWIISASVVYSDAYAHKKNKKSPYISTMSKSGASGSIVEKIMTPTVSSFSAFLFPVFHSLTRKKKKNRKETQSLTTTHPSLKARA